MAGESDAGAAPVVDAAIAPSGGTAAVAPLASPTTLASPAAVAPLASPTTLAPPTTLASFDAYSAELPEGIALDRFGNIYVSMAAAGEIWKLDSSGTFQEVVATFATAPGPFGLSGLEFDRHGDLYVTNVSANEDAHGVWKINSRGEKERIAGTGLIPVPNDVAISADGTVYITESAAGAIWRYVPGGPAAEVWIQDQALEGTGAYGLPFQVGANGIVVVAGEMLAGGDPGQRSTGTLIVANSEKGQVVRIPILPDGHAGRPTVLIADPASLFGLDGITADAAGTIYGAVNAGNRIVRISSDGSAVTEIASGAPLDFPSAVAFGSGDERDTLFIVNFSVIHFLSDPAMPGDAHPGVLAMPIGAGPAGND